jgi:hypothetical protein
MWFHLKGGLGNRGGGDDGYDDGGGTRVVARVWFLGEIGIEMHGGGALKLI